MSKISLSISISALILNLTFSCVNLRSQSQIWELTDSISTGVIREISCISRDICIYRYELMYDQGSLLKLTTDGGLNWIHIFADTTIINTETFLPIYIAPNHYNLSFKSKDKIILTAETHVFWYSNDLGKTWIKDSVDERYNLNIKMVDNLFGLMSKNLKGSMLVELFVTFNGGVDWHEITKPLEHKWNLIFFAGVLKDSSIYLYSVNEDWGYSLHWIHNLGEKWESTYYGSQIAFNDLQFISKTIGYGINRYLNLDSNKTFFSVLKTYDSGATWVVLLESDSILFSKLSFSDSLNGVIASTTTDFIIRTTDGGYSWHKDTVHGIPPKHERRTRNLITIDNENAFLSTSKYIFKLTDRLSSTEGLVEININPTGLKSMTVNKGFDLEIIHECTDISQIFLNIYDIMGKSITIGRYTAFDYGILVDLSLLASGIYLIHVNCSNKDIFIKVLIN